ncbi:MAG: hypothetical protein EHM42_02605, partial [Planctomycetaceae bacterium]
MEDPPQQQPRATVTGGSPIWLFPGLGCRYVGMGSDLIGRYAAADAVVSAASDWLGYDVVSVCLEGSGRKVVPAR